MEELVDPDGHGMPKVDTDVLLRYYPSLEIPGAPPNGRSEWVYQMINTKRPLEEKMALFWHQVLATGNSKIDNPNEMTAQVKMFREKGMGSYRELLMEVAKSPAMIYWLDNNENHKDEPNENWGRELLELFSMGVGNYTEQTYSRRRGRSRGGRSPRGYRGCLWRGSTGASSITRRTTTAARRRSWGTEGTSTVTT